MNTSTATPPLILASTSPYRRDLLTRLGLPFEVESPQTDETPLPNEAPEALALRLAEAKARAVAARHPGALVIGSDQVAFACGKIYGKPGNHDNAVRQLQELSGQTATFFNGLCVFDSRTQTAHQRSVPTKVTFRSLSAAMIEAYLRREPAYDCAGSAKSESLGIALIARIDNDDPTALVGLPLIALCDLLLDCGLTLLP
ncbi:MAG: Maf family nucleotide pyrophosphatase [Zoogloeaceae bacterium]|jgi:septum formation protein|nr:Maf family nucleotide pyrophosphatase [Zoogloeaceae bacterium]